MVGPPKTTLPLYPAKRLPVSKKRRVVVIEKRLLRGMGGPICRPYPPHREFCCLPVALIRNITGKLSRLVRPPEYYPLLVVPPGSDKIAERRQSKETIRALGQLVEGTGAQVVISLVHPVTLNNIDKELICQVNGWVSCWCQQKNLGFVDNGRIYLIPLLTSYEMHLSQRGKGVLAQELAWLVLN